MMQDNEILYLNKLSYDLESYAYDMRNNLDQNGSLEKFIDPAIKNDYVQSLNQTVEWIYDESKDAATANVFKEKLDNLR